MTTWNGQPKAPPNPHRGGLLDQGLSAKSQDVLERDFETFIQTLWGKEWLQKRLDNYGRVFKPSENAEAAFDLLGKTVLRVEIQNKQIEILRTAIEEYLVANDPTEFGCVCDPSVGHVCGPCKTNERQKPLRIALAKLL